MVIAFFLLPCYSFYRNQRRKLMEKVCKACQETKPLEEFHVDNSRPDGRYPYCKPCMRAKVRMYSKRAPSKHLHTPEGMRHCQVCKLDKPIGEFYQSKQVADGYLKICKDCTKMREDRRKDPQKHRDEVKKWRDANKALHADMHARWRYGVPIGTYAEMLTKQNGLCAICGTDQPGGKGGRFHIDHCHASSAVRGLLCTNCNTGLGQFRHREDLLQNAIRYLAVAGTERGG
jgi:hypothetical protein